MAPAAKKKKLNCSISNQLHRRSSAASLCRFNAALGAGTRRSARIARKAPKRLGEIKVCDDVWLGIFPSLEPAEVGLTLALLSRRFDGLVDVHFRTRKFALGQLFIQQHSENGCNVKVTHIIKGIRMSKELPIPQTLPPINLIVFKCIYITHVNDNVIAFLYRIRSLCKSGITLSFRSKDKLSLNVITRHILPHFKNIIIAMRFNGNSVEELQSRSSPTVLLDCSNLRSIYWRGYFFTGQEFEFAVYEWLHSPRGDGRPKVLHCPFGDRMVDELKKKFRNAVTSVNYIVEYLDYFRPWKEQGVGPFELENERTRERLTFKYIFGLSCWVLRAPIARDEKQWTEWEMEARSVNEKKEKEISFVPLSRFEIGGSFSGSSDLGQLSVCAEPNFESPPISRGH
uniref:F-box domain-containing protein n=1 Tax=Globodera rostochiensis TaxID=31243 RepID=A0A914HXY8_GLORO